MITSEGRTILRRYFAGQLPQIAGSVALGVSPVAETLGDTGLSFETLRLPVASINADLDNSRIVFKSAVGPGEIRKVYEIGLYSSQIATTASRNIASFRNVQGLWSNSTLVETNARSSMYTLKIDYVANGTTNAETFNAIEDLSLFTPVDSFVMGFTATANLSSVRVRMGSDSSNYFEFADTTVASGYNLHTQLRSTATVVGTPDWSRITYIAVRPSATAGGAGSIFVDQMRMQSNQFTPDNVLVARKVLTTPQDISLVIATDIEYSLGVTIS